MAAQGRRLFLKRNRKHFVESRQEEGTTVRNGSLRCGRFGVRPEKAKAVKPAKIHPVAALGPHTTARAGGQEDVMKRILTVLIAVLFLAAVPFAVLAAPKAPTGGGATFVVNNPNHTQVLGGSSTHASNGLTVASQHTSTIVAPPPAGSGSGSTSGGSGVPIVTQLP